MFYFSSFILFWEPISHRNGILLNDNRSLCYILLSVYCSLPVYKSSDVKNIRNLELSCLKFSYQKFRCPALCSHIL